MAFQCLPFACRGDGHWMCIGADVWKAGHAVGNPIATIRFAFRSVEVFEIHPEHDYEICVFIHVCQKHVKQPDKVHTLSGVITTLWLEDEVRALVNWHIQRFHFEIGLGVFLRFSEFSLLKHFQACWAADAIEQTQSSAARLWSGTGAESGLWQGGCTDQSKGTTARFSMQHLSILATQCEIVYSNYSSLFSSVYFVSTCSLWECCKAYKTRGRANAKLKRWTAAHSDFQAASRECARWSHFSLQDLKHVCQRVSETCCATWFSLHCLKWAAFLEFRVQKDDCFWLLLPMLTESRADVRLLTCPTICLSESSSCNTVLDAALLCPGFLVVSTDRKAWR